MSQNGVVQGEKTQEYVNISRIFDAAPGRFGQIPQGRPNGFHLEPNAACKGKEPLPRVVRPDLFAL
ncbi:hypothetical protein FHR23_001095 [Stakelama sediminis]|uniref:Uncharacterized protein n=1 Tax=Stakelama sediminis TaxID=463200 RepID=A0A840YWZ9_9SPHN|nr:hypothetical protein [Stakelama sediminis]MBB5717365.1 hypothetical protein [Stakelama sediminis]MBB5718188.1 hypothetical protein [Stakelama sediminis]